VLYVIGLIKLIFYVADENRALASVLVSHKHNLELLNC
jgi:hypothetical protein